MTFAYGTILAAALLPYLTVALAKLPGGIDNRAPRRDMEALEGWRRRADWAHRNHFEAFAPFAAAVVVAGLAHVAEDRIDVLAAVFVLARLAYTAAYVADRATLRSLFWAVGFGAVISLFVLAL